MSNSTRSETGVIFYIMNGYGVTIGYLLANIFTAFIGFLIVYLNYIVMNTMISRRDSLEVADVYVASLSGADLLTGVLLLYNTVYNMINYQNSEECRFRNGLLVLVAICSGLHLLCLAIDRHLKITRPLRYKSLFTKNVVIVICVLIWFFSLIIGLLPTFGWKNNFEERNNDSVLCTYFGTMHNGYILVVNVLVWTIAVLLFVIYVSIFKVAYRHAQLIRKQQDSFNRIIRRKLSDRQSWKFTKTITIIVGLYLSMWMPAGVLFIIHLHGSIDHVSTTDKGTLLLYVMIPAFLNSLVDPIIYAFKLHCVKQRFRNSVLCCCLRSSRPPNNSVAPLASTVITQMDLTEVQ